MLACYYHWSEALAAEAPVAVVPVAVVVAAGVVGAVGAAVAVTVC